MVKTNKTTSKKTSSKTLSSKTTKEASSQTEQRAAIKRILFENSHVKTCSCCGFQYVPMIAKVKGMEDLLNNICPGHELPVLKVASSYLNDCVEGNMSLNRKELEQMISEARGEEIYDEDSSDNYFDEEVFNLDDFRYSETDDVDYDDFAA